VDPSAPATGTLTRSYVVRRAELQFGQFGQFGLAEITDMTKVSLTEKLSQFSDHWHPRIVGELNGQHVKLVKFQGAFVWHHHESEDELFLVVAGRFSMEFRDRRIEVSEGEFLIVPRGVEHRPVAEEEVAVLLFEPAGTLNTGNVQEQRTRPTLERL
jgi:mannose-6-phosphate isomerase-like protein (cupin superfamily)